MASSSKKKLVIGSPSEIIAPKLSSELEKWRTLPCNMALIHSFNTNHMGIHEFLKERAEKIVSGWDIISTSLFKFDDDNALRRYQINKSLGPIKPCLTETQPFRQWAFILEVPPENIIGTYSQDVMFPNHIGLQNDVDRHEELNARNSLLTRNGLLSQAVMGNLPTEYANVSRNRLSNNGAFNHLASPEKILNDQESGLYNEELIMGRPDVLYHQKVSRPIKITGLLYCPNAFIPDVNRGGNPEMQLTREVKCANAILELNGFKKKHLYFQ